MGHHNYNNVPVILTNTSNQTATIGKVAKISKCSNDFIEECFSQSVYIYCSEKNMEHKQLLSEI